MGWWATLKLLWCHWDHVTRSVLLFLSRFGNEWSRLVQGDQMCWHSCHRRLRGSTWCRSQPATGLFTFLLNFVCIDISLEALSSVLVRLVVWQLRQPPPVFLGQIPQALHTFSADLLKLHRQNFRSLPSGPLKDTGDVSKIVLCCLGLLGSVS